jgi:hypothetical protein
VDHESNSIKELNSEDNDEELRRAEISQGWRDYRIALEGDFERRTVGSLSSAELEIFRPWLEKVEGVWDRVGLIIKEHFWAFQAAWDEQQTARSATQPAPSRRTVPLSPGGTEEEFIPQEIESVSQRFQNAHAKESEHDPPKRPAPQAPAKTQLQGNATAKPKPDNVVHPPAFAYRNRSNGLKGDDETTPCSEDGEKGLICSMLRAPGRVVGLIDPNTFFIPAYKILHDIICEWPDPDKRVDFIWLTDQLIKRGQLDEIGGKGAVNALYDFVPSADNADYYVQIVQEKYTLRQIIATCEKATRECRDRDADPGLIIKETQCCIDQALQELNGAAHKPYFEILKPSEIRAYKPPPNLVLIGDNHFVRGNATIIGGTPGVGKSRSLIAGAQSGVTKKEWFGLPVHTNFRTLIIQNENGRKRLQEELTDIDIDDPLFDKYVRISPPPRYGLCFWKREFRDQVRRAYETFGPHLVGLDPWNAVARDERAREYLEAFEIVRDVFPAGDDGPAIVIIAHTRKPQVGDRANGRALLNLLSGSYVLISVPRTVFVLQHASDDVDEDKVVMTCCKNNDGDLGPRGVWIRQNGLFLPVTGFDWEEWDSGENEGKKGRVFTPEKVAEMLSEFPTGLPKAELAKEIQGYDVGRATAYRAIDKAKEAGAIKFQKGTNVYVVVE